MKLEDIPVVAGFVGDGNYKYIVADVGLRKEKRTIIRLVCCPADQNPAHHIEHRRIGYRLMDEIPAPIDVDILGGGMFGKSGECAIIAAPAPGLGREPDPDLTVRLLSEAFPGCRIEKQLGYDE
ncbi:hypothetical protein A3A40_00450 [Candidatus Kaiserbacteria bacterium RIFCSPLOWO2_01_FULL_54_20]|uniref:Uncharacterized protein n=1 Tax=Candidatus Kaiserbacteria bacterium RIFCSPLOWO2_01_FULL_54_20 TaxID=1798513 RepID=A0A1F6EJE1_9BACT|nr:MAG: hypothetical protein A3A40_00450 [Candidatus Kaiserbacteria bacterium RIFCSPLOWO2_01_FULL_54_20]